MIVNHEFEITWKKIILEELRKTKRTVGVLAEIRSAPPECKSEGLSNELVCSAEM
jgi:hypothetical protein